MFVHGVILSGRRHSMDYTRFELNTGIHVNSFN